MPTTLLRSFTSMGLALLITSRANAQATDRVVLVPAGTTSISFGELAQRVAPVLWFSENEPADRDGLYPTSPDKDAGKQRVVYFKAVAKTRVLEPGCEQRGGPFHDPRTCRSRDIGTTSALTTLNLTEVRVRFFFYYKEDYGFGSHPHDLEALDVVIENVSGALVLKSVVGSAHGQGWYSNELRLDDGDEFSLPIHALVEEGKHATAPDRNADGSDTPDHDVSHYPGDAWGIRDSLSGSFQPGNRFVASMMKRRLARMKVYPERLSTKSRHYTLLHSVEQPVCDKDSLVGAPAPHVDGGLRRLLENKTFCRAGFGASSAFGRPLTVRPFMRTPLELLSLYDRTEGQGGLISVGYAIPHITAFRVPGLDGWLKPELLIAAPMREADYEFEPAGRRSDGAATVGRRITTTSRIEVQLTPSASRPFEWFASVGLDFARQEIRRDAEADEIVASGLKARTARFLVEHAIMSGGLSVHIPIPDTWLGGQLPPVAQLKLGLVTDEFRTLRRPRVMVQIGMGVF